MPLWKIVEKRLNEVCETKTIYSLGFSVRFSIGLFLALFCLFLFPLIIWVCWMEALEAKSTLGVIGAVLLTLLFAGAVIFVAYQEISDIISQLKSESKEADEIKVSNKTRQPQLTEQPLPAKRPRRWEDVERENAAKKPKQIALELEKQIDPNDPLGMLKHLAKLKR